MNKQWFYFSICKGSKVDSLYIGKSYCSLQEIKEQITSWFSLEDNHVIIFAMSGINTVNQPKNNK